MYWSMTENDTIRKYAGKCINKCMEDLPHRTKSAIQNQAYKLQVKFFMKYVPNINTSILMKERHKKKREEIKKQLDTASFDTHTPESSYIFGLLWGDGYLNNSNNINRSKFVSIGLVSTDFDDILFLFDGWKITKRLRKNRTKEITEAFNFDKNFGGFLYNNDFHLKKTVTPSKILSHIPVGLRSYFFRGWSDADGCFYVSPTATQFAMAGSYEQDWSDFEDLLISLNIKYTIKRSLGTKSKSSVVRFCRKRDLIAFRDYLYRNDQNIGLKRKHLKAFSIK